MFEMMGFGQKPGRCGQSGAATIMPRYAFAPSLQLSPTRSGLPIDELRGVPARSAWRARDVHIAAGVVPAGTVAAQRNDGVRACATASR